MFELFKWLYFGESITTIGIIIAIIIIFKKLK